MSRRGENIRKRKDGRWEGRYKVGYKENGSTKYASVYGHTYLECKNKLENKKFFNNTNDISKFEKQRFKDVLYLWLSITQIHVKKSTITKYQNMIETHILSELGHVFVSDLNSNTINSFLEKKLKCGKKNCNDGLSPSYVRSLAIIIESALKFAQREGYCSQLNSPILKPPIKKKELKILTIDTQNILESMILTNPNTTKLGVYIVLQTGLRLGEICALKWEDIDFKLKIINIKNTVTRVRCDNYENSTSKLIIDRAKTDSSIRKIPISSALLPVLVKMQKSAVSKYVVSDNADFVSTRTFEYRYKKLLKECGITKLNFHALRHTFATRCIEAGVDVKTLSEILGHSNVSITLNTYVHPSMDNKRIQIEKLCALTA